ncbi:uncharacterized protein LOC107272667 isoform X2 [Cephus cinctus]|nr:uncharacterized protein LOC107272667 isoform X2 [Cephus cinctus]XP_024945743.1 uncharacterized protein LOC107272667 isoform X2 [Cephus cinctus]
MYETHNPGFCYHSTGAIKESILSNSNKSKDPYEDVRAMLFTNGELDPEKVLCLHLLTAHSPKSLESTSNAVRPVTSLLEEGKRKHFTGPWNSMLPCYVVDVRHDIDVNEDLTEALRFHKDPRRVTQEHETMKEFQMKYQRYVENNADVGMALWANERHRKMIPNSLGRMPLIPPHVYSILDPSHELRVKHGTAEGSRKIRLRTDTDIEQWDAKSLSFRLDDNEDVASVAAGSSVEIFRPSNLRSPSRSIFGSKCKFEGGVTVLKSRNKENGEILSIKPSSRTLKVTSRCCSVRSPFEKMFNGDRTNSCNSVTSGTISPGSDVTRKYRRCIYLNSPIRNFKLRGKECQTVEILVNNQIQALVHSVLNVLERVNPKKMMRIIQTAQDPDEIRQMVMKPDIQLFMESLSGQPLVSSPESFVISKATVLDEIDPRLERSLEKELVAMTLEMPPAPSLDLLVMEIRNNLFVEPNKMVTSKIKEKVDTFTSLKEKYHWINEKELEEEEETFDFDDTYARQEPVETSTVETQWKLPPVSVKQEPFQDLSLSQNHGKVMVDKKLIMDSKDLVMKFRSNKDDIMKKIQQKAMNSQNSRKEATTKIIKKRQSGRDNANHKKPLSKGRIKLRRHITSVPKTNLEIRARTDQRIRKKLEAPKEKLNLLQERGLRGKFNPEKVSTCIGNGRKIFEDDVNSRNVIRPRVRDSVMTFGSISKAGSSCYIGMQSQASLKITSGDRPSSPKCQFKPWKVIQDTGYLDPDRIILRRMTNTQRILVGQMCASLKTRKINTEGLVKERTPLAALITPVLSQDSIKILTKGTMCLRSNTLKKIPEEKEDAVGNMEKLTGPLLAKVRQEVAENETQKRLRNFLKDRI